MTRRNKEIRAEERELQDGARSPRVTARLDKQTDCSQDTVGRLSKFARAPFSASDAPRQRSGEGEILLPLHVSEEEESEGEGACSLQAGRHAHTAKGGGGKGNNKSLPDDLPEPTLKDVLFAVNRCNTSISSLTVQLEAFKEDITRVRHDIQKVAERTTRVETRVGEVEDQLAPLQKDVRRHAVSIAALLAKTDDLENRSRRNNIRLVGVPEKVKGPDPSAYFESWILNLFGKEALTPLYAVERAHRVPMRPLPPGAPPRPILVKLLHFKDRDTILRKARDLPAATINGSRISFYPDFSTEVQKRRMLFQDIKRRLRALQVPYAMLYPAKLRVVALGSTRFFESPKDAVSWLDCHESQLKAQKATSLGEND